MLKSSLLLAGTALLGILWYISPILKPFPNLTGTYQIGTTTLAWTDSERFETYGNNPDEKRSVIVRLWYPAEYTSCTQPYFYLGQKLPYFQKIFSELYNLPTWATTWLFPNNMSTHACIDVPFATTRNKYPVILFSHGLGALPSDMYVGILENLASNGYIVIGIDHPYFNLLTLYPNGTVITSQLFNDQFNNTSAQEQKELQNKAIDIYKADMKFVLDQLALLNNDQNSLFYQKLALEHIGVMGHSAGGTAAIEFCRMDKRCKAIINLDGWYDQVIGYEPLTTPMLLLFEQPEEIIEEPTPEYLKRKNLTREEYYERERNIEEHKKLLCETSTDCSIVIIPGVTHGSFEDAVLLKWPMRSLNAADGYTLLTAINQNVLNFFNMHLK